VKLDGVLWEPYLIFWVDFWESCVLSIRDSFRQIYLQKCIHFCILNFERRFRVVKSNQLFNAFWQCLDERHSDIPHLDTCALLIPWENNDTTHPSNLTGKAKSKITISSKFLAYRIKSLHVTESRCKRHLKLSLKTYIYIERRTPKSRTDRIRYLLERSRYEKFSKGLSGKVKTC
jgi:hypothetical protein